MYKDAPRTRTFPRHIPWSYRPEQLLHSWLRAPPPTHLRSPKRTPCCLPPPPHSHCRAPPHHLPPHPVFPASPRTLAIVPCPPPPRPQETRRATRLSLMTPTNPSSRRLCGSFSLMRGMSLSAFRPPELADPGAFSAALTLFLATTDAVRSASLHHRVFSSRLIRAGRRLSPLPCPRLRTNSTPIRQNTLGFR